MPRAAALVHERLFPLLTQWRTLCGVGCVFFACSVYTYFLLQAHQGWLANADGQARLRATQMAKALSVQVTTLLGGIDFVIRDLVANYLQQDPQLTGFRLAVQSARQTFPAGSILQIAVADASGTILYSNIESTTLPRPRENTQGGVSIADREHFRVHADNPQSDLFISKPLMGRVSEQWTIQFSRAMRKDGAFLGVVVVSVSPDYLAGYFQQVIAGPADVAVLLRADGHYLARSMDQESVLGKIVPSDRPFLIEPQTQAGEYLIQASADGVSRYYAWHRTEQYPLVMAVGLGRDRELAPVRQTIEGSLMRNILGMVIILCAAAWIGRLFIQRQIHLERLRESEERLNLALYGGDLGLWDWNLYTHQIAFNARWAEMLGYTLEEMPHDENVVTRLTHVEDWPAVQTALNAHLRGETAHFVSQHRMQHRAGHWVWILAHGRVTHRDEDGQPLRTVGTHRDITPRRHAEDELATARMRLTAIIEHFPGGVLVIDQHDRVVMVNQRLCDILSLGTAPEAVAGQPHDYLASLMPADLFAKLFLSVSPAGLPYELALENGTVLEMDQVPVMRDGAMLGTMWLLRDVTQRRQQQTLLETLASTDTLTNLPNRRAFMAHLEHTLDQRDEADEQQGILIMLDLDHFKHVNDTYGHAVGDEVLTHLAAILQKVLRRGDIPGRLGGEEFAVLLPHTGLEGGTRLAERIRTTLADTPACTSAGNIRITASLGLCLLRNDTASHLLAQADAALYAAKHAGRNRVVVGP